MKKTAKKVLRWIFRPYITLKNGRVIYPKHARVFRIPIYE